MKKMFGLLFLVVILLASVSVSFADKAADDAVSVEAVMSRFDAGELTAEQALGLALEQDISFAAIIAACDLRRIPLSILITAAASVGISSEVALAKMADAGVSSEMMSTAIAAADVADAGLGYTKDNDRPKKPKPPKKPKKDKDPVSPSQL